MNFTNEKYGNFAKDPAVVSFKGRYYLYHSALDRSCNKLHINIAVSDDLENWTLTADFPTDLECEKNGVGAPGAIVLDGKVHLFYQTYGNLERDALCHAYSEDGINFVKNPENPVFAPEKTWCCGRAIDADVCIFNGKLYMYYATRDHAFKIQKIGGACAELDSGFGKGAWTPLAHQNLLCPELSWEGECIEAPATVVNNGKLFMFYGGSYNCTPQQIGCAVSEDGVFFKRVFNTPFIPCGEKGSWNADESGHPYAFRDNDGKVYLFYQGTCDRGSSWYLTKVHIDFDENDLPYIVE